LVEGRETTWRRSHWWKREVVQALPFNTMGVHGPLLVLPLILPPPPNHPQAHLVEEREEVRRRTATACAHITHGTMGEQEER
jgi:hypothetical protein